MPLGRGTFEVQLAPLALADPDAAGSLGRMSIRKHFHGDLEASSTGEMLTAGAVAKGSAGYVAVELVTGTLKGKSGSFALQHSGTMNRGVASLLVTIVPDSGAGELAGISGELKIIVESGSHSYELHYTLA